MELCADEIVVSVICKTYNHEKYIRTLLDSIVNQKTSFKFEVIVHDDASTDNTADIVREYEKKYPFLKGIYQTENQYSKHVSIVKTFLLPLVRGKYIASIEGDDYWSTFDHLQAMVDALEEHPECNACFSDIQIVNEEGQPTGIVLPFFQQSSGVLSSETYMAYTIFPGPLKSLPWQLSGLLMRDYVYRNLFFQPPEFSLKFWVGDIPLFLYIGLCGDVYYLSGHASCYRTGNTHSWLGQLKSSQKKGVFFYKTEITAFHCFDKDTEYRYHESVEKCIRNLEFRICQLEHDIRKMRDPVYHEYYTRLSFLARCKHSLMHYFPFLDKTKSR